MAQEMSLSELMDRASAGDPAAFGQLADAMQDRLYRFALAHGLHRADAAEAVQDAMMRAWRSRARWKKGGNANSWLHGITLNVVREQRRRLGKIRASGLDPDLLAGGDSAGTAEREERLGRMAEAMQQLPPRQREALTCRYLRQMSVKETAEAMGCAEGTVKAAAFAALENLRKALDTTDE
ncbi:MAG: RNA polymerase sigma factor [Phycisphaerae bacterium]